MDLRLKIALISVSYILGLIFLPTGNATVYMHGETKSNMQN